MKTASEWDCILKSCGGSMKAARGLLESGELSVEELGELALSPETGKPYGRRVLHESEVGEVLLVKWAKGEYSALHDHGAGSGVVCFLNGCCDEEYWDFGKEEGLGFREKVKREAGEVCAVKAGEIHRVRASGRETLTLHLYVPTTEGMRVFDPGNQRYYLVSGDCGAWLPDEDQILETVEW